MKRSTLPSIPELLHDAALRRGSYDEARRELSLSFECVRAHPSGGRMEERTVELRLTGVQKIEVAYNPRWPSERPSEFRLLADARVHTLSPWPFPTIEPEVYFDSKTDAETLAIATHRETLVHTEPEFPGSRVVYVHLSRGTPPTPTLLVIRCSSLLPFSGSEPLDLSAWAQEYAAWWQGWRRSWDSQSDESPAHAPPLDRDYQPPREQPFSTRSTDAPPALLAPVRTWFESRFAQDAEALAAVQPDLDSTPQEHVAALLASMLAEEYGSWDYACEVGSWWVEGRRAYVEVFGVTHFMPSDDEPAENHLQRWAFALRRRGEEWQVHTHVGGGEPDDLAARPWAQHWGLSNQ